jgi:mannosyl-oligosaccharide alpha-1,2-mannosidase
MLLGGQSQQPRKMYEAAIETAKSNLFYRPMTKDKNDILLSGLVRAESPTERTLDPEGQHLSCYIGGMMGIGSQIFDRKDDLPVARKLLDGCLWAYDNTPTGIMPEVFHTVPCENNSECEWDKKMWLDDIVKRHRKEGVDEENVDWKLRELRIDPGFSDIPDRRYILRCFFPCLPLLSELYTYITFLALKQSNQSSSSTA